MGTRDRATDDGAARAHAIIEDLARELRQARRDRGLSQDVVAQAAGVTRGWVSKVERGLARDLTFSQASKLLAVTGLRLWARAYPDGRPVRDAAHLALLDRFRRYLHPSLRWATEVPVPVPGDLRAWDAQVRSPRWTVGVEAETRPRDVQALKRRLQGKARDSAVDGVVLVLLDSRHNRDFVRLDADGLAESFPVPGARALDLLAAGVMPGSAIVLL